MSNLNIVVNQLKQEQALLTSQITAIGTAISALKGDAGPKKRTMSAAGRRRIVEAQRERWAKVHRNHKKR